MRETTFILLILLLNVHKQQTNKQENTSSIVTERKYGTRQQ